MGKDKMKLNDYAIAKLTSVQPKKKSITTIDGKEVKEVKNET